MGDLVPGDDGLPAEEVGPWAEDKFRLLTKYVTISSPTRKKYLGPKKGGAAYVDLFCGPGQASIKTTGKIVDGGCVAAWKTSVLKGAPFSRVIIADADADRLAAAQQRLQSLGAPVIAMHGKATETAFLALQRCPGHGLNFAFLDPYSLGALDFEILKTLARLKRIDMLIHVSQMDLNRNFARNLKEESKAFEAFAPGWLQNAETMQSQKAGRAELMQYWRDLVATLGTDTSTRHKLITTPDLKPLYILLLAAKHDLAHTFWDDLAKNDGQQAHLL